MTTYIGMRDMVVNFLSQTKMSAYDLYRISKDLCCCRSCTFFVQHYSKDGKPVDFGHCRKGSIPKCKKPSNASCAEWQFDEESEVV